MQCFHCGREVRETSHTQKRYNVDYYRLHTGNTEWEFFINPKQDAPPLRYLKLTQPVDILTCVQCYARAEIRQELDDDFTNRRSLLDGEAKREKITELDSKSR
jgi:hypothetical protein